MEVSCGGKVGEGCEKKMEEGTKGSKGFNIALCELHNVKAGNYPNQIPLFGTNAS